MEFLKDWFKRNKFDILAVSFLAFFVGTIAYSNYAPSTWLTGWDNHHPEFDFLLSLKRDLFTAWRENRGLGLIDGISHATEIPRTLLLLVFSPFLGRSSLRYFYHFLMLFLGPVGLYFFLRVFFYKTRNLAGTLPAFLGSLFYLLNLGTLQNFYTPLSTFTTLYGFLPWLLLFAFLYVRRSKLLYLGVFAVLSFFAVPLGYTATLFLIYCLFLGFSLIWLSVFSKDRRGSFKNSFLLVLFVFLINSFWLLPFTYFFLTKASVVSESTINRFSSEEVFLKNKKYGTFKDVALLRGYSFDTAEFDFALNEYRPLYASWISWHKGPVVFLGYLAFAVVFLGFLYVMRKGTFLGKLIGMFFLLSFFSLMSTNPPFGFLFRLLQNHLPFFKEALRFPFTKFSIFGIFSYAFLFSQGFRWLSSVFLVKLNPSFKKLFEIGLPVGLISLLLIFMFPMFKGSLFYSGLRVNIPSAYFDLFTWSEKADPEARTLYMPLHTYWSWRRHDWGYVGSGFLRYGLRQPLVDRSFDPWSPYNEAIFKEASYAFYKKDPRLFLQVLDKYNVKNVLYDSSVFVPGGTDDAGVTEVAEIRDLLNNPEYFREVFRRGFLHVYEYKGSSDVVESVSSLPVVSDSYRWAYSDVIYHDLGDYIISKEDVQYAYPFFSLADYARSDISVTTNSGAYNLDVLSPLTGRVSFDTPIDSSGLILPFEIHYQRIADTVSLKLVSVPFTITTSKEAYDLSYSTEEVQFSLGEASSAGEGFYIYLENRPLGPFLLEGDSGILDTLYLSLRDTYTLSLYVDGDVSSLELINDFSKSIENCNILDAGSFELSYVPGFPSMEVKTLGNSACITAELSEVLEPGFYVTSISKEAVNSKIGYCLIENNNCVNNKNTLRSQEQKNPLLKDSFYLDHVLPAGYYQIYVDPIDPGLEASTIFSSILVKRLSALGGSNTVDLSFSELSVPVEKSEELSISIPKVLDPSFSLYEDFSEINLKKHVHTCFSSEDQGHDVKTLGELGAKYLHMSSYDKKTCFSLEAPNLPHSFGYAISFDARSLGGKAQKACFKDVLTDRCVYIDTIASSSGEDMWKPNFFFVPSLNGDVGYRFRLENISFGVEEAVNDYDNILITPFPVDFVQSLRIKSGSTFGELSGGDQLTPVDYVKRNPGAYVLSNFSGGTLVLNQSFDTGWVAFCGMLPCRASHEKVNSWANGWVFEDDFVPKGSVTLIFWPQYLEYMGFSLVFGGFGLICFLGFCNRKRANFDNNP